MMVRFIFLALSATLLLTGCGPSEEETKTAALEKRLAEFRDDCKDRVKIKDREKCYQLGKIYWVGEEGVPIDKEMARTFFGKACRMESPMENPDVSLYCNEICDLGELSACRELGAAYHYLDDDEKSAASAYRRGCSRGDVLSCGWLGLLYVRNGKLKPKDAEDNIGQKLLAKACEAKNEMFCKSLGEIAFKANSKVQGRGHMEWFETGYGILRAQCEVNYLKTCPLLELFIKDLPSEVRSRFDRRE